MCTKKFKKAVSLMLIFALLLTNMIGMTLTANAATTTPCNPNATQGCKNLLYYLNSIIGSKIVGGQYNYASSDGDLVNYTNRIHNISGKYPGLWGSDWSFNNGTWTVQEQYQGVANAAIQRAAAGDIISLMWHMPRPDFDIATAGWGEVQTGITDTMANNMITPGTTEYNQMISRIDAVAPYLKQLRDAGVTVLWRPYHEMNYGFFWWGGRPDFVKSLWWIMYDRYTNYHGLNNLLWVWNVNTVYDGSEQAAFNLYYPGSSYVDVISVDRYSSGPTDYSATEYNTLVSVDNTKVAALGENGNIPDPDYLLGNGINYTFFMIWGNFLDGISDNEINSKFNHSKILTNDELNIVTPPSSDLDNLVKNPEFDNGTTDWYWTQSGSGNGSIAAVTGQNMSGNNALKATLSNGGSYPWNTQINQTLPITSGKNYTISFMAKADTSRTANVMIQQDSLPYAAYWSQDINLTTSAQTYTYTFDCNSTDSVAVLRFNIGGNNSAVYIDRVVITAQ